MQKTEIGPRPHATYDNDSRGSEARGLRAEVTEPRDVNGETFVTLDLAKGPEL